MRGRTQGRQEPGLASRGFPALGRCSWVSFGAQNKTVGHVGQVKAENLKVISLREWSLHLLLHFTSLAIDQACPTHGLEATSGPTQIQLS